MISKKEFFEKITYIEHLEYLNDYETLLEIFDYCYYLTAVALRELVNLDKNAYAIALILKYRRYWQILGYIDKLLSLEYKLIQEFIEEKKRDKTIVLECKKEEKEYGFKSEFIKKIEKEEKEKKKKRIKKHKKRVYKQATFDFIDFIDCSSNL